MKTKDLIPFKNTLSNPDLFNYNLSLVIDDLNTNMLNAANIENSVFNNIAIYDTSLVESLRHKMRALANKLNVLQLLTYNQTMSNMIDFDLNKISSVTILDPKKADVALDKAMKFVDDALLLNSSDKTFFSPSSVVFENITAEFADTSYSGIKGIYVAKETYSAPEIVVSVGFNEPKTINSLSFSLLSDSPVEITKIEYLDETWIPMTLSFRDVYSDVSLVFPEVETTAVKLHIKILNGRGVNSASAENIASYISNNTLAYLNAPTQSDLIYNSYIYYFAFKNMLFSHSINSANSYFISEPVKVQDVSSFSFDSLYDKDKCNLEFYAVINYLSNAGVLQNSYVLPILPRGDVTFAETIYPQATEVIIDDVPAKKEALLSFAPDPDAVVLKENGVAVSSDKYLTLGKVLYFTVEPDLEALFTIEYTPYNTTVQYLSDCNNPTVVSTESDDFEYSIENHVYFNPTTKLEVPETDPAGKSFLRFAMSKAFNKESISVDKYKNETLLDEAPLFQLEGDGANIYVVGRFVYIPFEFDLYKELYTIIFRFTYTVDEPTISNAPFYYASDNSVVVNWEWFKQQTGYDQSTISLLAVSRNNITGEDNPSAAIYNLRIYYNTFNDTSLSVENL
jgi:hypothetical protein